MEQVTASTPNLGGEDRRRHRAGHGRPPVPSVLVRLPAELDRVTSFDDREMVDEGVHPVGSIVEAAAENISDALYVRDIHIGDARVRGDIGDPHQLRHVLVGTVGAHLSHPIQNGEAKLEKKM